MKDDSVYLDHIAECLEDIDVFVGGDKGKFFKEKIVQNATLRSLQTLSESVCKLSDACKVQHPAVPWRQIQGFRNIIVHNYLGIDLDTVWEVIATELPKLKRELFK